MHMQAAWLDRSLRAEAWYRMKIQKNWRQLIKDNDDDIYPIEVKPGETKQIEERTVENRGAYSVFVYRTTAWNKRADESIGIFVT